MIEGLSENLASVFRTKLAQFDDTTKFINCGEIVYVVDGIIHASGLSDAMFGELIKISDGRFGLVLRLDRDIVSAVIFGDSSGIYEGQQVFCTGEILEVPIGDSFLGRIVDSLCSPIDGKGAIQSDKKSPIEKVAPGIIHRKTVNIPLHTGILSIDSMVPIGRGQRELLIGDRQTGKTSIAIDMILSQKNTDVYCIYVSIGQKNSDLMRVKNVLMEHGVLEKTIIVVANASDPVSMQYIAPYVGCTLGEHFRDTGRDALIVYDDLTKHAWAYRQISLMLKKPPGREAYPGDVFYLHSRLLERASRLNEDYIEEINDGKIKGKSGSLTAIPIVEIQLGDLSAYIPTNIISITDGQILLDKELFNSGVKPAVNVGLSVSRVGGSAQIKTIKQLAGGIRTALAQYKELEIFNQFSSDLDQTTLNQLIRGKKTVQIMKQNIHKPLDIGIMAFMLQLINSLILDSIELEEINEVIEKLEKYVMKEHSELLKKIENDAESKEYILQEVDSVLHKFFDSIK